MYTKTSIIARFLFNFMMPVRKVLELHWYLNDLNDTWMKIALFIHVNIEPLTEVYTVLLEYFTGIIFYEFVILEILPVFNLTILYFCVFLPKTDFYDGWMNTRQNAF